MSFSDTKLWTLTYGGADAENSKKSWQSIISSANFPYVSSNCPQKTFTIPGQAAKLAESYSPLPCNKCSLTPGTVAKIIESNVKFFPDCYRPYIGLVEVLKCHHPGSITVQVLNNGPCHGKTITILREYVSSL